MTRLCSAMYLKKVLKPAVRKRLVGHLQDSYPISQRRACRLEPISGKGVRYTPLQPVMDAGLIASMKQLAEQYPRYGYLTLHELLRRGG